MEVMIRLKHLLKNIEEFSIQTQDAIEELLKIEMDCGINFVCFESTLVTYPEIKEFILDMNIFLEDKKYMLENIEDFKDWWYYRDIDCNFHNLNRTHLSAIIEKEISNIEYTYDEEQEDLRKTLDKLKKEVEELYEKIS